MNAISSADQAHSSLRTGNKIQNWWQALARRRRIRKTAHLLEGLDDRMLKDIGLDRSEINSYAQHGCFERRSRLTIVN